MCLAIAAESYVLPIILVDSPSLLSRSLLWKWESQKKERGREREASKKEREVRGNYRKSGRSRSGFVG